MNECVELVGWSVSQLNEFLSELEWNVQHHSETLIAELALRDELEFEKELKNTFISLLLNVQNKRRQMAANHKKAPTTTTPASSSSSSTTTSLKNANKCAAPSTDAKVTIYHHTSFYSYFKKLIEVKCPVAEWSALHTLKCGDSGSIPANVKTFFGRIKYLGQYFTCRFELNFKLNYIFFKFKNKFWPHFRRDAHGSK